MNFWLTRDASHADQITRIHGSSTACDTPDAVESDGQAGTIPDCRETNVSIPNCWEIT